MTTVTAPSPLTAGEKGRAGDKFFSGLTFAAGALILVVLLFVTLFLVVNAYPALVASPAELTGESFFSYVWPLVLGTLLAAGLALLFATPVAIGVALFISHVAPRKLAKPVGYVIDLLAAIPSVVYGAWGMLFLASLLVPIYDWLHTYLGWIPLFGDPSATGRTILTASIVLAVMVLPIITALSREIFVQTPKLHEEAALALGATRWEMIKMAVLPFARPGVISAIMLGLGRALGETMAVLMILSPGLTYSIKLLRASQNQTIAANIAAQYPEADPNIGVPVLIGTGLVLFVITFLVNFVARKITEKASA